MKNLKGVVLALVSSSTFGLIPLFSVPLLKEGLQIPSIMFYRFLFSTLIMGVACLLQKRNFSIQLNKLTIIFALGLFYAFTAIGLIFSYTFIPTGIATTIHFLYPVLVTVIMVFLFKERKSLSLILSAILSIVGVAFLCWSGNTILNPIGIIVALSTVVTYAVYIVGVNKSGVGEIDSHILTFYILLVGAIVFCIFGLFSTGIQPISSSKEWFNLLLLAFLPTVISDLTLILAIKYAGSTTTSILGSMEPLVAVCIGVYFFSESFGYQNFVGLLLVIMSVILVILSKRNSVISKIE